jgi:hypothetical protein
MEWWQDFNPVGKSSEDLEDYVVYKLVRYADSERLFRFPSGEFRNKTILKWYDKDFYRWTNKHWDLVDPFFEKLMNNGLDYVFIPRIDPLPNSSYMGDWINQLIWAYKDIYESFSRPWIPPISRAPDPPVSRALDPVAYAAVDSYSFREVPENSIVDPVLDPEAPEDLILDPEVLEDPVLDLETPEDPVLDLEALEDPVIVDTVVDPAVDLIVGPSIDLVADSHVSEASGSAKIFAPETYINNIGPQVRKALKSAKTLTPEISLELLLPLRLHGIFELLVCSLSHFHQYRPKMLDFG